MNGLFEKVENMSTEQIMKKLTNEERMHLCTQLLNTEYTKPIGDSIKDGCYFGPAINFVFKDHDKYIAVDNRTHDCWIEQFDSEHIALSWITDKKGDPS